jgi:hypothetical protein
VQVLLSWFWNWLLNARDARLITGDAQLDIHVPRSSAFVPPELPPVPRAPRRDCTRPEPPVR